MTQALFSKIVTLFLPYGAAMSQKRITILKGHVLRLQGRVIPLEQIHLTVGNKNAQRPLIGHLTHVFTIEQISIDKFWELVPIPQEWRDVLLSRIEVLSPDWISESLRHKNLVNPEPYRVEFMRVRFIVNFKYSDPSITAKSLREEIEESSEPPLRNGSFKIGEGPSNSSSDKKQLSSDKPSEQHKTPFESIEQLQRTDNLDATIQTITQKYKSQKTIRLEKKFGKPENFTGYEPKVVKETTPLNEEFQDYLVIDGSACEKTPENLAALHANEPLNQRLLAQFDQEVASSLESLGQKTKSIRDKSPKRKNPDEFLKHQVLEPLEEQKEQQPDTFEKPLTPRKLKPTNSQLFDYILHNLDQIEDNESLFLKSETSSQMHDSPQRSHPQTLSDQEEGESLLAGISNLKDIKINRGSVPVMKSYEQKPLVQERKEQFWEKKKKYFAAAAGKQKFLNQNDHIVKPLDELRAIYQLINDRGRMYAY